MVRYVLPLSVCLLLAGSAHNLGAQAMVENALGAGRAATTTAPASNIGKAVNGLAGALEGALKGVQGAAANPSGAAASETARPTTAVGTGIPAAKPGSNFEDPLQIAAGMTYEEVLRRFGPPRMQFTDGPGTSSLAYSSKDGGVQVAMRDGKVASVAKPKS